MTWPRTWLFVPGDRSDRFDKATSCGADAVIVDLEDAVEPAARPAARLALGTWLSERGPTVPVWVRVSAPVPPPEDLAAATGAAGIVVPKVVSTAELDGLPDGIPVVAMVETARGLRDVDAIAQHPAVVGLMIGEYDLAADLGMPVHPGHPALDAARASGVGAAAAAGLESPIGPVDADFSNPAELEASTRRLVSLGFGARAVIHPVQVDPVHRGLAPSDEEVAEAERVVAAFESAGSAIGVDRSGRMMDEATVRGARRVLARAGRRGAR
ncbi:MAG: CoA ester lyase [Acidimicrobiia bacterium]